MQNELSLIKLILVLRPLQLWQRVLLGLAMVLHLWIVAIPVFGSEVEG
jgi:hypothetical protein